MDVLRAYSRPGSSNQTEIRDRLIRAGALKLQTVTCVGSDARLAARIRRVVRTLDDDKLTAALRDLSTAQRFEDLLELFDAKIQGLFGDTRPDCIIVCFPEVLADLRISNPKLSAASATRLERLQQEEEQEQLSLFQPTPEELKAAEDLRTQARTCCFARFTVH